MFWFKPFSFDEIVFSVNKIRTATHSLRKRYIRRPQNCCSAVFESLSFGKALLLNRHVDIEPTEIIRR